MPFSLLLLRFGLSVIFFGVFTQNVSAVEPPHIAARSYIVLDGNSHRVLLEKNADERLQPASLTKLMTAYIVLDALRKRSIRWEQLVSVRSADVALVAGDEATMHLKSGQIVSVQDLLTGLIVISANDAAMVLARTVSGSPEAFLTQMNEYARRLELNSSHFATPSGVTTEHHYSTAHDIAALSMRLTEDFPVYLAFSSQREFRYGGIVKHNKNRLLGEDPSVDGLKTGHTAKAGYCLAATSERTMGADHEVKRIFAIVLGASTNDGRFTSAKQLINFAFQ